MLAFWQLFAWCDLHASRWRLPTADLATATRSRRLVAEYYDRQGFPIPAVDGVEPALVWARMFEDPNYRRVALDELPDGSLLSTAWLGLYYGFGGQPYIFETMRFKEDRGGRRDWLTFPDPVDGGEAEQLRYTTEEEALAAHHEIVRRLRIRLGH